MNPPEDDHRRRLLRASAGAALFAASRWSVRDARAQSFPSRPLRLVVPFPAGGPTDIVARPLAQLLSQSMGQAMIVDNRGGAGGSIGADSVAKSPPDGYTLLLGTVGTHAINPALYRKLPYDASKDFTPLGLVALAPMAIVVNPATPYKNISELIAAARASPGTINFGSAGNGTPGHLTGEMFAKAIGAELRHVPYKGSAPGLTDLLGGQIPLMFDPVQSVLQHVRTGKLRALAVSSLVRSAVMPEVATLSESGLNGFEATAWWALFAPAGLPADVLARLATETNRAIADEGFRGKLGELGVQAAAANTASFAEFQRSEMSKWSRAVRDSGVTLE